MRSSPPVPTSRRQWGLGLLATAATWTVTGCALPAQHTGAPSGGPWTGRLALQVDDASAPSYAALFELEGSAAQGRLSLTSPLGTVLGIAEWSSGHARLTAGSTQEEAPSLDALLTRLTGTPLPIAALFDWLQGEATAAPGWTLERLDPAAGRIVAHRTHPLPRVSLRIALSP